MTAISFDEVDDGTGLQDVPQVLGLNLYFGWYYRTLDALGPWLDSLHARHPDRPIIVSEYGADSDERIHARQPRAFDFSADWQQRLHEATWPQLARRDWLVRQRGEDAVAVMRAIKHALDPRGLLNPGRML